MRKIIGFLIIACLWGMAGAAQAQARYTCRTSTGGAYISDRPCSGAGVVYYGPETQQRYEAPIPSVGEAPQHLKYLSPRCSSLNDAIRTGPARGLRQDTMSSMQKAYRVECGENESEAQSMLSQERGEKAQQQRVARTTEKQQIDQARLHDQQCGESKRILFAKRARTDLNDGEKAELQRFEANYRARCS